MPWNDIRHADRDNGDAIVLQRGETVMHSPKARAMFVQRNRWRNVRRSSDTEYVIAPPSADRAEAESAYDAECHPDAGT